MRTVRVDKCRRLRWARHVAETREDKLYIQNIGGESSYKLVTRDTEEKV